MAIPTRAARGPGRIRTSFANTLSLERVGKLHENLPIQWRQSPAVPRPVRTECVRGQLSIVTVPEVHDRLPVQLVGEQDGSTEVAGAGLHGFQIETGIAIRRHVLGDRSQ